MSKSFKNYGFWTAHNGKVVKIDGINCRIKTSVYTARYPYTEEVISVYAEPIGHNTEKYREIKRILKDDWATDVLECDLGLYCDILRACESLESVDC